ncbi:glycosyl hydrolase family 28-related protein [Cupriavidus basilensis]
MLQFVADKTGQDVLDDGDVAALQAKFTQAIYGNIGDDLVLVEQPDAGAVLRTQHDKNAESLSAMDFGATGIGLADDTAAIQAALATGRSIYLPAGVYNITDTLYFTRDGQVLHGDGKDGQTVIRNVSNGLPLFATSKVLAAPTDAVAASRSSALWEMQQLRTASSSAAFPMGWLGIPISRASCGT